MDLQTPKFFLDTFQSSLQSPYRVRIERGEPEDMLPNPGNLDERVPWKLLGLVAGDEESYQVNSCSLLRES